MKTVQDHGHEHFVQQYGRYLSLVMLVFVTAIRRSFDVLGAVISSRNVRCLACDLRSFDHENGARLWS